MKKIQWLSCLILLLLFLFALTSCTESQSVSSSQLREMDIQSPQPRRVILFVIDGFALGTPENPDFDLSNFNRLKKQGTYFKASRTILPGHPDADYDIDSPSYYPWGCSLPNPTAMSGSVFVGKPGLKENLIQHSFDDKFTAFTVNCGAYDEIAHGYDVYHQLQKKSEDLFKNWLSIDDAKEIIKKHDPSFLRVHMQGPGSAGYNDRNAGKSIWDMDSHYKEQVERADDLLGEFVTFLEQNGFLEDSVLFITGDNGQYDGGWHPPYEPMANKIPMLIYGKGIKQGAVYDYAEHQDIVTTIANMLNVRAPRFAEGRIMAEAYQGGPTEVKSPRWLDRLNTSLLDHKKLVDTNFICMRDDQFAHLNEQFLLLEEIGTWHRHFSNLPDLVRHNESILNQMKTRCDQVKDELTLNTPRRLIFFIIDGLAWTAPEKMEMPNFNRLKSRGIYYPTTWLPLPGHPEENYEMSESGYYPWTASIPNPVNASGTVFIGIRWMAQEFLIQHSFASAGKKTLFVVNADAYDAISHGFTIYKRIAEDNRNDESPVVEFAKQHIGKGQDPYYIRIHLQGTGSGGWRDKDAGRSIWDSDSKYRERLTNADKLLGDFVNWLDTNGYMDETVLFIGGDHGESDSGGHDTYDLEACRTPMLVMGKGIKKGVTADYAENIDLAPTFCEIMGIRSPKYSEGRIMMEIFEEGTESVESARYIQRLDEAMVERQNLISNNPQCAESESFKKADAEFATIDKMGTWHMRFDSIPELVGNQEKVLAELQKICGK